MHPINRLPPVLQPGDPGYLAARDRAAADKIYASMEVKRHGRVVDPGLRERGVIDDRPPRAISNFDPMRW